MCGADYSYHQGADAKNQPYDVQCVDSRKYSLSYHYEPFNGPGPVVTPVLYRHQGWKTYTPPQAGADRGVTSNSPPTPSGEAIPSGIHRDSHGRFASAP